MVGVGAVLVHDGKILLVKRGTQPGKHQWTIPGGLVNLGETVHDAVVREVQEESNLDVTVHSLIDVVDNVITGETGKLRFHFIILDFFVHLLGGTLQAGSDALAVRWVPLANVEEYDLTEIFRDFVHRNYAALQRFDSKDASQRP
jgi:ADP-ribose pyrophosphatase